jgi:histone-lysine N-methyltransferase SUV420H
MVGCPGLSDRITGYVLIFIIGENYFGDDNCECLCKTCEDERRNGWAQGDDHESGSVPKLSIEQEPSCEGPSYSFRRKRRLGSSDSSRTQSMTPDINIRPHVPKRTPRSVSRFKNQESPLGNSPSLEPSRTIMKRKREAELLTPSPSGVSKKARSNTMKKEVSQLNFSTSMSSNLSRASSVSGSMRGSLSPSSATDGQTGTDATSVDEDTIVVQPRLISPVISKLRKTRGIKAFDPLEQTKSDCPILVGNSTSIHHPAVQDDSTSVLSELESDMELDDSTMTITSKNGTVLKTGKKKGSVPSPSTDLDHAPAIRVPGDYVLTPALLAEPASAWINCKICEEPFVQKDAYFTRSSCPRCERHSKLYGYMWPKTDKEGKNDTEERILDHRTVHRFIRPEEERTIRKRDRGATDSRGATREVSEVTVEEKSDGMGRRSTSQRSKRDRFTL